MTMTSARGGSSLTPIERARDLLAELTVEEKARQLTSLLPSLLLTDGSFDQTKAGALLGTGIGGMSPYMTEDPSRMPAVFNSIQRYLVEETRAGIPAIFHAEALSGVVAPQHPIFPTAIGLASSWSPDLVLAMTETIRAQMLRLGLRQALSPVMDVAFDPRWGRIHETYGEDPVLAAAFSVAFVRGLQGTDLTQGVVATAKHFIGYGLGQGGLNGVTYEGSARFTRDVLAYPIEAAIHLAGLRSVMNSYGEVNGVPAGASRELLTDLLRGELGFTGITVSDYMTMQQFVDRQLIAADAGEAGRLSLNAGLDMEFPYIYAYGETLAAEVAAGRAPMAQLDAAVLRVLTVKFELGLFDQPYAPEGPIEISPTTGEGVDVARELARRSVVLLENDGVLPLRSGNRIAVIGPNGHEARQQFPTYTHPASRAMYRIMMSGGLGNMVGTDAFQAEPEPAETADLDDEGYIRLRYGARSLAEELAARGAQVVVEPGSGTRTPLGAADLERAVAAARDADIVVLALGGFCAAISGDATEGEGTDSADIVLPAPQIALAEAVIAAGTPVVALVVQGRGNVLPDALSGAAALVIATFAGQEGNGAIADVLLGEVNPSGRLPYSIPRHVGQLPVFHYQKAGSGYRRTSAGHMTHYVDMTAEPRYPFGSGIGYTSFDVRDLVLPGEVPTDGVAELSLAVTNTGDRAGAEVVQVYARVNASGISRPTQQHVAFARVELEPQQSARVTLRVPADLFGFCGLDGRVAVEPGRIDIFAGANSEDRRVTGSFLLTGERRVLDSTQRAYLAESTSTTLDAGTSTDTAEDGQS